MRSMFDAAPSVRLDFDDLLAVDDRLVAALIAVRGRGRKAGAHEVAAGAVYLVEDGRWAGGDFYDLADRQAVIARYVELGGGMSPLGMTVSEQLWAEFARGYARRDGDALKRCLSADVVFTDHRSLGWDPVHGDEGLVALMRTGWNAIDIRMEPDEVLAATDRVCAVRLRWTGTGDAEWGGGPFALAVGQVAVVENGRIVSVDQYDHDGDAAMLARFAELEGRAPVLGDRPPEQFWRTYLHLSDKRDYGAMAEMLAPDCAWVDHRALAYEEAHGREQVMAVLRSTFDSAPDVRNEVEEVIACDGEVMALISSWHGRGRTAGPWRIEAGIVAVIRHGQEQSLEFFEPEDRRAIVMRYVELGGGLAALGESPPGRACAEHSRRLARRDVDEIVAQFREDYVMRDHRSTVSVDVPKADVRASFQATFSATETLRLETDEVLAHDERVIARRLAHRGTAADGGGAAEVRAGWVTVVEDGLFVSTDVYEYDDDAAMLAKFAELSVQPEPPEDRSPARWLSRFIDANNGHDPDAFAPLLREDFVLVDHRANGWGRIGGPAALREHLVAEFQISPDISMGIDCVLAGDHRAGAACFTYRGHMADGGGEFEYAIGYVTLVQDGRALGTDVYEPEDREAMIARYVELGGGLSALGDSPLERLFREYARRFAHRDVDALAELIAADYALIDHRPMGWEPARGRAALQALHASSWDLLDIRIEVDEVLAVGERAIAMRVRLAGHAAADAGGGEFSLPLGRVTTIIDGLIVSVDQYEAEDREAMLTRFHELEGLPPTP
jgi:ketosteroid isomerase-like protein